jgi:hypothetical protein
VLLAIASAALLIVSAAVARTHAADWTGTWDTKTGAGNGYTFKLVQSGSSVTGTVTKVGQGTTSKLESGTVRGRVLTFKITTGGADNKYEFTLSADGQSFTGRWGYNTDAAGVYGGGTWSGQRAAAKTPAKPKPPSTVFVDWSGAWDTRTSTGLQFHFLFKQSGRTVTGTAQAAGGGVVFTIANGTRDGPVLTFTITSGATVNKYEFTMGEGSNRFTGRWGSGTDAADVYSGGTWSGRRAPFNRFKVRAEALHKVHPYRSARQVCHEKVHSELDGHGLISSIDTSAMAQAHPGRVTVFQKIYCFRGSHREDHSVQWQVLTGRVVSRDVNLNWGDRGPTKRYTETLLAEATQSVRFDLCPLKTRAEIILVYDRRWLPNGSPFHEVVVNPVGATCPVQTMTWSNADDPLTIPPRGGLGRIGTQRGQFAETRVIPIPTGEFN